MLRLAVGLALAAVAAERAVNLLLHGTHAGAVSPDRPTLKP